VTEVATACASPPMLTPGVQQTGDTSVDAEGSIAFAGLNLTCAGFLGAQANPYSYTPGQDELVAFQLASAFDQGIIVRSDCTDATSQVECVDAEVANDEYAYVPMSNGQTYTVFAASYSTDSTPGAYTLDSTAFPLADQEPNDSFSTANTGADNAVGIIMGQLDEDWFSVVMPGATALTVTTTDVLTGDCTNGRIDTEIEIFNTDGTTLMASHDDIGGGNFCSTSTTGTLAAGTYFVRILPGPNCPGRKVCRSPYRLGITTN
jgi:hypothetical protein